MKKIALVSTLILFCLFSCRKDVDKITNTTTTQPPIITTIIDYDPVVLPVVATVFGEVKNENGLQLGNAVVRLGNNVTTTDERGRFVFKDITMNKAGTFLTVNYPGYFEGSDRFFPEEGSANYSEIVLLAKTPTGNFVANDGGTITSQDGIRLDFPPNAIIDAAGNVHSGEVAVSARWLDPTSEDVHKKMPGGLQGIDENAELVALASFGMMVVELEDTDGNRLNLGNGLKATLTFPIPDEQINNAPTEIPLWSFYNEYGVWVEEGVATKTDGHYIGEVAHFSWWNCDDPFTLIELSGMVNTQDTSNWPYATVCLELVSTGELGCITTNQDGFFSGPVPLNESFIMTIYNWDNCNEPSYIANIGPFSVNTDLGIIDLSNTNDNLVVLSGTVVDCSNNPLTNGWVEVFVGSQSFSTYVSNGEYTISFNNCNDETEISIQASNIADLQQSNVMVYPITSSMTIPEIAACGNLFDEWLTTTINGSTNTYFVEYSNIFGMGDSILIFAFDPINANFNVEVYMTDVVGQGVYDGSQIQFATHSIQDGTGGLYHTCFSNCSFSELEFTEFGANPDEYVEGSYSGTLNFTDNNQNTVTHFLEVAFRVKRQ